MYRLLLLTCFFFSVLLGFSQPQVPQVPTQLEYCGIQLTLNAEARKQLATYVSQIHQSPRYFQEMVHRAQLYMPYIEQAFKEARVPQDLKYLAIQESGLRPAVVSSSQAVGFWQFKIGAAQDMGLTVNGQVDERRHIYRASQASAEYLAKGNEDYNNWVYAVIAYYEGPTGSVKHTDPIYYGQKRMAVTEQLHWYVMKAIAHKIAYEAALDEAEQAPLYLRAHRQEKPTSLEQLLVRHQISRQDFISYNQWLLNPKHLEAQQDFVYFTPSKAPLRPTVAQSPPAQSPPPTLMISDVSEETSSETPPNNPKSQTPIAPNPESPRVVAQTTNFSPHTAIRKLPAQSASYVTFPLVNDLHYGQQYVRYDGSLPMIRIAETYGKPLSKLLVWNGLLPGEEPGKGRMIYLLQPSKREYHIVRAGESLLSIADLHLSSVRKVQKKNGLKKQDHSIYEGQKLYLKKKKPRGEKNIILIHEKKEMAPVATIPKAAPNSGIASYPGGESKEQPGTQVQVPVRPRQVEEQPKEDIREVKTKWITHIVSPGETLWQISQRYGTKVEIIKMINKLEVDSISNGQQLKILAKEDLLRN